MPIIKKELMDSIVDKNKVIYATVESIAGRIKHQ